MLSAFGKLLPPERRGIALGAGTAAGSFGQFLFAPFGVALIDNFGWQTALTVFAGLMLLIVPLSLALATPPAASAQCRRRTSSRSRQALAEAFGHRSYVLLVLGFFTCGFQLAFITVHLPAYLVDRGLSAQIGGWMIAVHRPVQHHRLAQRRLAAEPDAEALHPVGDLFRRARCRSSPSSRFRSPPSPRSLFGAVTGLIWLSTVPPTSALVALMFGTRWLATLYGFAFFSHQVGGFLGVWLGGVVFEQFGSYDAGLVAVGRCSACCRR